MKPRELYDRDWRKDKKTQHQDNVGRLRGRHHGQYVEDGKPRQSNNPLDKTTSGQTKKGGEK